MKILKRLAVVIAVALIGGVGYNYVHKTNFGKTNTSYTAKPRETKTEKTQIADNAQSSEKTPNEQLASSVLTDNVKKQLGNSIKFNNAGAFEINNNKATLNGKVTSTPWAKSSTDTVTVNGKTYTRPTVGDALINKSTYQTKNREETGNGRGNFVPAGWHQLKTPGGAYSHAIDRGHLLAYALVGNMKGFDASESNEANIAVQTAWANEARRTNSTGQNYFEGLVRNAVMNGQTVRYRVTDVYDGDNLVPSGAHIEAVSYDGSLNFNVFVPNVQNGLKVNYATGEITGTN